MSTTIRVSEKTRDTVHDLARKGGVPKERVLNCLNLEELTAYLAERRNRESGWRSAPRRVIPQTKVTTAAKQASAGDRKRKSAVR